MRFSIWPSTAHSYADLARVATHAEETGWDGVWIADHFMPGPPFPDDGPQHECFAVLAGLAATVPRVRLGSLVAGNTYRHPAVLVNQAVTIDHISGGRFVLGLGAGWQEREHTAYGIELPTPGGRLRRLEEAAQVIRSLRDAPRSTFDGDHYDLRDAPLEPKPFGPLPLLLGGGGERVMPGIVARWADEWNTWGDPQRFAQKSHNIDGACQALGRDPATVVRSTQALVFLGPEGAQQAAGMNEHQPSVGGTVDGLIEVIGAYQDAGVSELIIPDFHLAEVSQSIELWDTLIEAVFPSFRPRLG